MTLGRPFLVEQDVVRLEVAMDDASIMGVLDRLGDLLHQRRRLARGQRSVGDLLRQAGALDEAHAEIVLVVVLTGLVDRHDRRVLEPGGGLGLQAEPLDVRLVWRAARPGSS